MHDPRQRSLHKLGIEFSFKNKTFKWDDSKVAMWHPDCTTADMYIH